MGPRDPSDIYPFNLLDAVRAAAWDPPNLPLFTPPAPASTDTPMAAAAPADGTPPWLQPLHDLQRVAGTLSPSLPDPASPDDIAASPWTSNGANAPGAAAATSPYTSAAAANRYLGSPAGGDALDPARTRRLLERAKRAYDFVEWMSAGPSVRPNQSMQDAAEAADTPRPGAPTAGIDVAVDQPAPFNRPPASSPPWLPLLADPPQAQATPQGSTPSFAAPRGPQGTYWSLLSPSGALLPVTNPSDQQPRTGADAAASRHQDGLPVADFSDWLAVLNPPVPRGHQEIKPDADALGLDDLAPPTSPITDLQPRSDTTAHYIEDLRLAHNGGPRWQPMGPAAYWQATHGVDAGSPWWSQPEPPVPTAWDELKPAATWMSDRLSDWSRPGDAWHWNELSQRAGTQAWPGAQAQSNYRAAQHGIDTTPPPDATRTGDGAPGASGGAEDAWSWSRLPERAGTQAWPGAQARSNYWQATHGVDTGPASDWTPEAQARAQMVTNRLFGLNGVERYHFFPERWFIDPFRNADKLVRAGVPVIDPQTGLVDERWLATTWDLTTALAAGAPKAGTFAKPGARPWLTDAPPLVPEDVGALMRPPRLANRPVEPFAPRPADFPEVDLAALEARAQEIHAVLGARAQNHRTTAVLGTNEKTIVGGGKVDLDRRQIDLLHDDEVDAELPGAHAEITVLWKALARGYAPRALATSRPICSECRPLIEAFGGKLISPTLAIFPTR